MSISYSNRHLYELHPTSTRNFGVQAAALPSIKQLNLNHNHLRSLECPFDGRRGVGAAPVGRGDFTGNPAPPLPLRPALPATAATAATTAATSLEEEGSGLRGLTSLSQLLVSHNELRTLRGLCGAAHTLTTLIATHNHLTSLDGMQACRHLTYIDLSHNDIESLRGLPQVCGVTRTQPARRTSATAATLFSSLSPAVAHTDPALELSSINEDTDTYSIAFATYRSLGESPWQPPRVAAAGRSISTTTSIQFRVEDTPTVSADTPVAFSILEGNAAAVTAAASADPSPSHWSLPGAQGQEEAAAEEEEEASEEDSTDVVLILSHNRLRGRALAALLWVDSGDASISLPSAEVKRGARSGGPSLLRPWSTALTSLDLSHNYIEDIDDVRRLFAHVPWPVAPARGGRSPPPTAAPTKGAPHAEGNSACVVSAPVLQRLRRLDLSDNPCLVNGSLARSIMAAPPSSSSPPVSAPPSASPSARRETVRPSDTAQARRAVAASPFAFRLRFSSPALADVLRSSASLLRAATFEHLPSAQLAMEAVLQALADDWRDSPPSPLLLSRPAAAAALPASLFALFAPSTTAPTRQRATQTVLLLYGGEVTVLAAALRQHGVRLGTVLRVPTAAPLDRAALFLSSAPTAVSRAADGRDAPRAASTGRRSPVRAISTTAAVDVFLTPPPKWGSDTATSTTFLQASLLGGGSSPPRAGERSLEVQSRASSSTLAAATVVPRPAPQRDPQRSSAERGGGPDAETSTVGYRLLQGCGAGGAQRPPTAALAASESTRDGVADDDADMAGTHEEDAEQAPETASSVGPVQAAVTLQQYKAEVEVLRRRLRELQRHEEIIHEWQMQAVAVQAELAQAQHEIRRLQAEVLALNPVREFAPSAATAAASARRPSRPGVGLGGLAPAS
ncbi:hypothetical protein ABB37_09927 [Leptomonas pyrrhocoris]|uniref:Leucine-rich repeat protein n=1 Tax=Leptomonas pyrrhocoris TaxID=157538 RepID=A0A0M9FPI7_LEPPY|nr:hypothetical protein ABB37_09927 [Leptomonas pyrrhocoris]KPA73377.1 hypothetical protein ABB37_09927 [Leptomonas pyrrhocoris]|eukprot:XP_015651816.1 hypothetical protein ABB37_09927 [Leptomonas pyrrhocoris]